MSKCFSLPVRVNTLKAIKVDVGSGPCSHAADDPIKAFIRLHVDSKTGALAFGMPPWYGPVAGKFKPCNSSNKMMPKTFDDCIIHGN